MSNRSLLVTGASGFVGLNLLQQALAAGHDVVGLSAAPVAAPVLERLQALPGRYTEVIGDVRERGLLTALMREHAVDRVAHLAAITASAARERVAADQIIAVNLAGLAAVMSVAAEAGAQRFLSTSSIAVYGGQPPDGSLMVEDTPHAPQNLYAITKSSGEAVTARLGDLLGLDGVIARLGRVFGPFEHDTGVRDTLSQIHQVTAGAIAGQAVSFERPCLKNWSYAPDVAARLLTLLNAPQHRHRIYNLGTEHAWTLADWCGLLARRYADFRFRIGASESGDLPIDLVGPRDSGLLSWQRFADEFHPPASADLPTAFEATLRAYTGTTQP
jgi:UDP-glucuronate 4-epimerase